MKIRSLYAPEKDVLKAALNRLLEFSGVSPDVRWAAKSMLNQNMVDNFLWIQKREEEEK